LDAQGKCVFDYQDNINFFLQRNRDTYEITRHEHPKFATIVSNGLRFYYHQIIYCHKRKRVLRRVGKKVGVIPIVSNNPLMKDEENVLFVEGTFRDVLVKVRDMVYEGYEMISHPLFASGRMMFSPVRTVIMGDEKGKLSEFECRVIEEAISMYDVAVEHRNRQPQHDMDYAYLDRSLYLASLDELAYLR
jgi:hypothetical protein